MKLDLAKLVGKSACDFASYAGNALELGNACQPSDYTVIGWTVAGLVIISLIAYYSAGRERRRRDSYWL